MKIICCPVNGPRPLQEFRFGGEVRFMPDPGDSSDEQWADYVFNRSGEPGVKREWWYHIASGTWFVAERNTVTDEFVRTYLYEDQPADE
ncbi:MAG: sarcosine oxidase subunit delta [Phycisphaeraceae bacterium]|nr:sarcosine oxidase subunit delta [Phycisphaeraceae bacterium]|tara:strand:+ start:121 stop:387 length:267 start_codon:yes stop_codon:yes gene_type:complete